MKPSSMNTVLFSTENITISSSTIKNTKQNSKQFPKTQNNKENSKNLWSDVIYLKVLFNHRSKINITRVTDKDKVTVLFIDPAITLHDISCC